MGSTVDYSRWDSVADSDDERTAVKVNEEKVAAARRKELAAKAPKPPKVDWAKINFDDPSTLGELPPGMSDYMKAMSCGQFGAAKNKAKYKIPDTKEEKTAKANEAAVLKERGNALFAQGERFEAAKLYEQAVLKFDWFSDLVADDAERAIVLPIKVPCHLNLALMSLQLGNHHHAIVHCTQALLHDPVNGKALFRRGQCYTHIGELPEAKADLLAARKLTPSDVKIGEALAKLKIKIDEYNRRCKSLSRGMVDALGKPDVEGSASSAEDSLEAGAGPAAGSAVLDAEEATAADDEQQQEDSVLSASAAVARNSQIGQSDRTVRPDSQIGQSDRTVNAQPATPPSARAVAPDAEVSVAEPADRAVTDTYRCLDCPPGRASMMQHPVLGPICGGCHLVLCANE
mmetsp:Transcript_6200/g.16194  ORF Transcript_6200/g.16194 Transcript_6200/m.16194 type:complete len:402 (+) Transcript_6200:1-1206(+)